MCGIAGVVDFQRGAPQAGLLERMAASMAHRGPDDCGVWHGGEVALSHTRLAIVDPQHGAQPMRTGDGRLSVSFNGEIFNHRELRALLEKQGRPFRTHHCDTEVVLQAYAHWGESCFEHFNGQWAIALWDTDRRRLLLSRDRFGICPLHYTQAGSAWVFASEAKALFCHPAVAPAVDVDALCDILRFWTPLPGHTAFRNVSELEPGCCLAIEPQGVRHWRYWQLDYRPDYGRRAPDWHEELRALLSDAVRLRLQADVPLGLYLSGGLDSSVVGALADQLLSARGDAQRLSLFSVQFDEQDVDERHFQHGMAQRLGRQPHALACANAAIGQHLIQAVRHTERPLFRTAAVPLFLLSRRVRAHDHKVVLTGEGADEVFGGYDLFKEAKLRRFVARQPGSKRRPLLFRRLYPYLPHLQAQSPEYLHAYFQVDSDHLDDPFFSHRPRWRNNARLERFLSPEVRHSQRRRDPLAELAAWLPQRFSDWDYFERAQYLETTMLLPGYILSSQGDRVAMAHGVETRPVFLDHRLAALAARMPAEVKMRVLDEKHVLKQAAGDLVTPQVLRRPKQPYRAPESVCFRGPDGDLAEPLAELLRPASIRRHGLFDPDAVSRLLSKARTAPLRSFTDNAALVFILSTQALLQEFVPGSSSQ